MKKKIILLTCSSIATAYIYAGGSHTSSGLYGNSGGSSHANSGFYRPTGGSHTSSGLSDKENQTTIYTAP
jgi:hypothetical protein